MKLTVGALRELMKDLPDDAPVFPDWANGPPGDSDPAVVVEGFAVGTGRAAGPHLSVLVDIAYLDDEDFWDEPEDDDEEDDADETETAGESEEEAR